MEMAIDHFELQHEVEEPLLVDASLPGFDAVLKISSDLLHSLTSPREKIYNNIGTFCFCVIS